MIDDRLGIGFSQHDARRCASASLEACPRTVDGGRLKARQLRDPLAHVSAVRIELFGLQHGIEDPEIGRGIDSGARDPLPVERIVGRIGVDQRIPEPCLAVPPVDEQVLDEKGSDDQARAIGQISRPPQLSHPGVNDRIAGMPMRPGLKSVLVVPPGKALELGPQRTRRHIGMGVEQGCRKVAPGELGQIFLRGAGQPMLFRRRGFDRVRDAARRNLAETQVRRQARRGAIRQDVPLARVVFQLLCDEGLERGERAFFARGLAEAEFARPVGLGGLKPQGID